MTTQWIAHCGNRSNPRPGDEPPAAGVVDLGGQLVDVPILGRGRTPGRHGVEALAITRNGSNPRPGDEPPAARSSRLRWLPRTQFQSSAGGRTPGRRPARPAHPAPQGVPILGRGTNPRPPVCDVQPADVGRRRSNPRPGDEPPAASAAPTRDRGSMKRFQSSAGGRTPGRPDTIFQPPSPSCSNPRPGDEPPAAGRRTCRPWPPPVFQSSAGGRTPGRAKRSNQRSTMTKEFQSSAGGRTPAARARLWRLGRRHRFQSSAGGRTPGRCWPLGPRSRRPCRSNPRPGDKPPAALSHPRNRPDGGSNPRPGDEPPAAAS